MRGLNVYVAVVSTYPSGTAPLQDPVEQLTSPVLPTQPQNVREFTDKPVIPCPAASFSPAVFIAENEPALPKL
jgi:hypothetical protein